MVDEIEYKTLLLILVLPELLGLLYNSQVISCPSYAPTSSVILSEAKNLFWTNAQFFALAPDSARDSSLHFVPFENNGQRNAKKYFY